MSETHTAPFKWRRHRGWAAYTRMILLLAATTYVMHWFIGKL